MRPAPELGNVRVRSQAAGGSWRPPKRPSLFPGKPSVWRLACFTARGSQPLQVGQRHRWSALPSPSLIPQRPGLGGTRTQAGLRTGLGDIGGLPRAGRAAVGRPNLCLLPSSSPDLHLPADQLAPAALPVSWEVLGWAVESGDIPSNGDRARGPITFWGRKALVTREAPGAVTSISEAVLGF